MLFLSALVLGLLPTSLLAAPVQPHARSMTLGPGPLVLPSEAISALDVAAHKTSHVRSTHPATKLAAATATSRHKAAGPTQLTLPVAISNLVFRGPDSQPAQHALAVPNVNTIVVTRTVTALAQSTPQSSSTTDAVPNPSSSPAPTKPSSSKFLVATYWPDWTSDVLSPEQVDFDRFDWVDYAFAIPTAKFNIEFTQDNAEDLLTRLVKLAHAKGKFVKLSVGGWTGSGLISNAVATDASRTTFVNNINAVYRKFDLDGIDIDWEYPGTTGAPGNAFTSSDASHYLTFLHLLRATLPDGAKITAATQVWPFTGGDGRPMADVRAFAKVLDWILLMSYDVWGSSSHPGPNAPLSDVCHNSTQPLANAQAAIKSWNKAGFPLKQLTMGIAAYGYLSQSTATHLATRNINSNNFIPLGRRRYASLEERTRVARVFRRRVLATRKGRGNGGMKRGSVTIKNDSGGTESGQIQFRDIVAQGALKFQDGSWVGTGGFQRFWDVCSSTPFLRSEAAEQVITYDDPTSLELKGALVRREGILGVNMWDAHGDTADWQLIDAVRRGLGVLSDDA